MDSRANWTVEVELTTDDGVFRTGVPSGASRGKEEAVALAPKVAVKNINEVIAPKLKGKDPVQQKEIDDFLIKLDGTKNKSKLGANAVCGVSLAVCRAGAAAKKLPLYQYIANTFSPIGKNVLQLPMPAFNIINGGAHASNELDFQEFMIVPPFKEYSKNLKLASEIYQDLRKKLGINVGDEGGFAPPFKDPEQALELISRKEVKIIIDVAASQFSEKETYKMRLGTFTRKGLLNYYSNLIKKYPIVALEDPFSENDWQGFQEITKEFGKKITIIGDDLLVTNPERIKEAHKKRACNGLLLKINQIGTLSEALESAALAKSYGWKIMVSHRSGETCDNFIADLAVGIGANYIKAGAPARGERVAKYNRLLKIEEELKNK